MEDTEMSEKELSFEPIRIMELEIQERKMAWLTKYGWEERCDFVDSCWRWCKIVEGKMMMCTESQALKIERDFICDD